MFKSRAKGTRGTGKKKKDVIEPNETVQIETETRISVYKSLTRTHALADV